MAVLQRLHQDAIPAVSAMPRRGPQLRALCTGQESHGASHTLQSAADGAVTVKVAVVRTFPRTRTPRRRATWCVFVCLGIRDSLIGIRQRYRKRFGIETAFGVQRRMADFHFAEATTWEELVATHDRWVADYNYQDHWAHRARPDERFSPAAVLAWVKGQPHEERRLQRIFYTLRFTRRVDRYGYVRFRHWRVYSESGLIGHDAILWLHKETLTVTFADQPLASYTVKYARRAQNFESITNPLQFTTQFRSPQLMLWEFSADDWYPILRAPRAVGQPQRGVPWNQLAFPIESLVDHEAA